MRAAAAGALCAIAVAAPAAPAEDLSCSAEVDTPTVSAGSPVTFTLTCRGRVESLDLPKLEFPPSFVIAATSEATTVSVRMGRVERAVVKKAVLVPQEPGEFEIGPFSIAFGDGAVDTEPVSVTVEDAPSQPAPSRPKFDGERFTI